MKRKVTTHELSGEAQTMIQTVDSYLADAIRNGRPIEALIATRRLGEITSERAKEAARAATSGSWSWTDVGAALGMTKQAAHEKLRARVRDDLDKARTKLHEAEEAGHAKIARRAARGRARLDEAPPLTPKIESVRQRIDEWERSQHDKLTRNVKKGREELSRAEQSVQENLNTDEYSA